MIVLHDPVVGEEGWQNNYESNHHSHDHLTNSRHTFRFLPSLPPLHPANGTSTSSAAYLTEGDVLIDSQHQKQPIFNHDILHQILAFCSISTILTLLQLSKSTYLQSLPHLYESITLKFNHQHKLPPFLIPFSHSTPPLPASDQEWKPDPHVYIKHLSIPAHLDSHPHHSLDLPNLHTLHLTIHRKSPLGWSFCKPSDARYPYYPISRSCSFVFNLQPKRLIVSGVRYLNTPSPFPLSSLNGGMKFWEKVEEVILVLDREGRREESRAKYRDGFLDNLPKGLKRLSIILGLREVDLDEILDKVDLLDLTSTVEYLPKDQQDRYGLDLVSEIVDVRIINFHSGNY